MNNKEFISELSQRLQTTPQDAQALVNAFSETLSSVLEEGDVLNFQNFGVFEVKKKLERIIVNPSTKQRMLVPPKLTLSFKPSVRLKEQSNEE